MLLIVLLLVACCLMCDVIVCNNTDLKRISELQQQQAPSIDLEPHLKKLNNARRRIVLVNNVLQNAQVQVAHVKADGLRCIDLVINISCLLEYSAVCTIQCIDANFFVNCSNFEKYGITKLCTVLCYTVQSGRDYTQLYPMKSNGVIFL